MKILLTNSTPICGLFALATRTRKESVLKKYQASQKNSYHHLLLQLAHGGMALLLLSGLLIKPPPMARVLVMTNAHALHLRSLDAPLRICHACS
jgi:thiosulfate reductase cytochrome b subunit